MIPFVFIVLVGAVIPNAKADALMRDDGKIHSPLMMFFDQKGHHQIDERKTKSKQERELEETKQQIGDEISERTRGSLESRGIQEPGRSEFSGTFLNSSGTTEGMMTDLNVRASPSFEAIQATIASNPKAAELIPGSNGKSLVFPGLWSKMFTWGAENKLRHEARNILKQSVTEKYGFSVAQRVCLPLQGNSVLSAPQADRILKMAAVIHGRQSDYPLSTIRDEQMNLVTYARDAALVAQEAVVKFVDKKATLLEILKKEEGPGFKKEAALNNHPEFIAARDEAMQATQHAVEAAENVVTTLEAKVRTDSSFGAQVALAAAQLHTKMARRVVVMTGQENDLNYKAEEALYSASDAHDAYQAFQESKTGAVLQAETKEENLEIKPDRISERSTQLQQTLRNFEAIKKYATKVTEKIDELSRVMQPSSGSEIVPIQRSSARTKLMINDALTKVEQLQEQLKHEATVSLKEARSEDEFCREAIVQRLLLSSQRNIANLKSAIENALKITSANTDVFFKFHQSIKNSYERSIQEVKQSYQEELALSAEGSIEN